ncbi:hypothetical protein [Pseudoalteromonas sp. MMG005]|uniref:hypothetical protein n=1 Tax=Pseudoalteromonas sp. MMG005 TaxID=2822682 RepID=UPI001B3A1C69|nr:hypothetical protein [Pseudoalteromonas sp. MMG005]MBQ4844944.1 hypothetical protein [Pseudoalteromonas sp. MMG005]
MTLEQTLTDVALEAAKHADSANKLIDDVKNGIDTINVVSQNHSVMDDWRTKTGKVAFKDIAGNSHEVDTLASIIADAEKINPNPHVMTKAQFDALREIRKKQYAGSGFVEWGKCYQPEGNWSPKWINNGLYQSALSAGYTNELLTGSQGTNPQGVSNTDYPESVIDGVTHKLSLINSSNLDLMNRIKFPTAPDGTKTYDSATGIVTEHASSTEAFNERKIKLGSVADGTYDVTNSTFKFESTKPSGFSLSTGKPAGSAKIVVRVESSITKTLELRDSNSPAGDAPLMKSIILEAGKTVDLTFNYTITSGGVYFRVPDPAVDQALKVHTFQVLPTTESVITSRKDLVFLESWHEKIADKDVVYPLGNVQYGATDYQGIALQNNLVAQGYSAFGEWDADTTGHGAKWSSLSEANRAKLLANPAHNIYYDPEVKAYIQVRYRIRVVEGIGDEFDYTHAYRGIATSWRSNRGNADYPYFNVRGQNVSSDDYYDSGSTSSNGYFNPPDNSQREIINDSDFEGFASKKGIGHNNKCFAVPIALVQRMNQGAYHPTYNPMGCKTWAVVGVSLNLKWHSNSAAGLINFTAHCFEEENLGTRPTPTARSGYIGAEDADSGRSDQYKHYDAIYAGQIEDLRLNANKLDVNQLREETMRKAVAGTLRGKSKVPFTHVIHSIKNTSTGLTGRGWVVFSDDDMDFYNHPLTRNIPRAAGTTMAGSPTIGGFKLNEKHYIFDEVMLHTTNKGLIYVKLTEGTLAATNLKSDLVMTLFNSPTFSSEFDSLPWVDIVGDPARIAATFPNGVVGQWIPQIPLDGISQPFIFNRKNVQGNYPRIYTLDNGATWTMGTHTIHEVPNTTGATFPDARYVSLFHYEAPSNFTEASSISSVIDEQGGIWYGAHYQPYFGNRLQPSLTGKVATNNKSGAGTNAFGFAKLERYVLNEANFPRDPSFSSIYASWMNVPLNMSVPTNNSSAVKTAHSVVEKDGLLYLQFHGAELKYDTPTIVQITLNNSEIKATEGSIYRVASEVNSPLAGGVWYCNTTTSAAFDDITWSKNSDGNIRAGGSVADPNTYFIPHYVAGWGDDQIIPIVSGENVKTDLNGNTVKVFCHHTQIPIGIAHHG